MADAVTLTTIEDGPKRAIFYLTNTSDGTGEAAVLKVDTLDYSDMSGLPNVAASGGNTGDIQLTTVGHSSGDTYSIVLHCLKQY